MNGKLFISAVVVLLVAVAATANASAQNIYLFHRQYWHGIPDGGGMRDYIDAVSSDAGLTAAWSVDCSDSSCVPWLVGLGEDGFIENQKAIEANQSTLKGCGVKIAKTSWGYVVIAGDHLVGLDNNFNVLWCKEPKNHFDGGDVILSVGDSVVIGSADSWALDIWTRAYGAVFMSIDQSGKITRKETIHWWDGGFSDMIRDSSGNYVALGTGGDHCSNSRIVKLDSNLHTQWIIGGFPDIQGSPRVNHIVENSNGVYIAAGEAKYGWEGWQRKPWIMATDKDGNVLWAKTYDSLDHLAFGDVVVTQDGGLLFLVVGAKDEFGTEGPVLLKTDAEGNPQWCKWYKNDVGYAKIVPADDGYYIVGSKWGNVGDVFSINRSEWLWYGSIFKVDLEGNIPSDAYEVEEWQVEPPQTWSNVTYEKIEISHFSPEEWDPTFVDSDMPVTLQNEPKVATVFEYVPNKPPVASFTYSPENLVVGQAVTFDASGSYDLDGSIVSYEWDFGDGTTETTTSPTIQHTYSSGGIYTVTLTVTDNDGLTDSYSTTITVYSLSTTSNLTVFPQDITLSLSSTTVVNIVVSEIPPTGLSYANISVSLLEFARITSIEFPTWATLTDNSTLPSSTVWFKVGDLSNQVKAGDTNVVLAKLTIEALNEGSGQISIQINSIQDDNYNEIKDQIATVSGTITVITGPPPINGMQPKDLNGDGLFEDVNGNGQFNFGDVVFFFKNFDKDEIKNYPEYYDFNNDGLVNFGDVVALFKML